MSLCDKPGLGPRLQGLLFYILKNCVTLKSTEFYKDSLLTTVVFSYLPGSSGASYSQTFPCVS